MKTQTLALLFLLFSISTFSQTYFQSTYGNLSLPELGKSAQQTSDGGYILLGNRYDSSGQTSDLRLTKLDPLGNEQWNRFFDKGSLDLAGSVREISSGGYIISGVKNPLGNANILLIKTNSNGDEIWTKTFSFNSTETRWGIVRETSDGGYIIIGTVGPQGFTDIFVIKTDADGNEEWSKSIDNDRTDAGVDVQETSNGDFIVLGSSFRTNHEFDSYLALLENDGDLIWETFLGGNDDDNTGALEQTSDGGFVVIGSDVHINHKITFYKVDGNGTLQWNKEYGSGVSHRGSAVHQTSGGGFILAGTSIDNTGETHMYIVRTDAQGNLVWDTTYPKGNNSYASAVEQTEDGGFIFFGGTSDTSGFTSSDFYLVKTDNQGTLTSTRELVRDELTISLFPNPMKSSATLLLDNTSELVINLKLIDVTGRVVRESVYFSTNQIEIERGDLSSGLYFYSLESEGELLSNGKLIIE